MTTDNDALGSGAAFYPGRTTVEQQVSIFLLGCRHAVSWRRFDDWFPRVGRLGWLPHPFLLTVPGPSPVCGPEKRLFGPQLVLTPPALAALFGETWGDGVQEPQRNSDAIRDLFRARLSSREGDAKHVENLLLTRDAARCPWLGVPLTAQIPAGPSVVFTVEWADLWLFDDASGMLAIKARLDSVTAVGEETRVPTFSDIGAFHRYLRDWQDQRVTVRRTSDPGATAPFWEAVVFTGWLGAGETGQHLLMQDGKPSKAVFDDCSRYCKLLTGIQVTEIASKDELAWSSPIADPPGQSPDDRQGEEVPGGRPGNALMAYQAASMAGYPTYRDLLVFELATTSAEGAAGGHRQQRGWQYSMDYVRHAMEEGGIRIWEYWDGLALRDVCAFVAWSDSMPLIKGGQLEARYYPIYVHAYHLRHELDGIASQCIDHDLVETKRLRDELRRFQIFRSRYWFREVTRDFQGVEVFRRMKRGMEVDDLFETVSAEVREVSEYLEGMSDRGRQALIVLMVVAGYPLYLWFTFAGDTVTSMVDNMVDAQPLVALGVTVLLIVALAALFFLTWTSWAPKIGRWLHQAYAWLARERL